MFKVSKIILLFVLFSLSMFCYVFAEDKQNDSSFMLPIAEPIGQCPECGWYFTEWAGYPWPSPSYYVWHPGKDMNVQGLTSEDNGTSIYAIADGVVETGPYAWGSLVISHNYSGQTFYSQYGHCRAVFVQPGDFVKKGQKIAEMGDVGADGQYHLHFETRTTEHPAKTDVDFWTLPSSSYPDYDYDGIKVLQDADEVVTYYHNPEEFIISKMFEEKYNELGGTAKFGTLQWSAGSPVGWYYNYGQAEGDPLPSQYTPTQYDILSADRSRDSYKIYWHDSYLTSDFKNCYYQRFSGGEFWESAIVFDALHGARNPYCVKKGFAMDETLGWLTKQGGPNSVLGMPLNDEYTYDGGRCSTQDFRYGYLFWDGTDVYMNDWNDQSLAPGGTPTGAGPGTFDPASNRNKYGGGYHYEPTWNNDISYLFVDCYNRNGKWVGLGNPVADGHGQPQPQGVHKWGYTNIYGASKSVYIQTFLNLYDTDYPNSAILHSSYGIFDAGEMFDMADYDGRLLEVNSVTLNPFANDIGFNKAYLLKYFWRTYYQEGLIEKLGPSISDAIYIGNTGNKEYEWIQLFENGRILSNDLTLSILIVEWIDTAGSLVTYTFSSLPGYIPDDLPHRDDFFIDDPLTSSVPVRVLHIIQLRNAVDEVYKKTFSTDKGYPWSDADLQPQSIIIKKTHIDELRTAIDQIYKQKSKLISWSEEIVKYQTFIKAAHIQELRDAIDEIL